MMLSERPLEYCFICGEPTGKAGQGDGSLYCECDKGPFCEECWDKHHNADTEVAQLEAENTELQREKNLLNRIVDRRNLYIAQLEADRERDAQIVSDYSEERGRLIKKIARWRKALEKIQKDAADPWCINIARETLKGGDDGGS